MAKKIKTRSRYVDGLTREGYIAPRNGHEGLMFDYRPMTGEQVEELLQKLSNASGGDKFKIVAVALATHITDWSECDQKGETIKIAPMAMLMLPWSLAQHALSIIQGVASSDPQPKATESELDELMIAAGSKTPGLAVLEERMGN